MTTHIVIFCIHKKRTMLSPGIENQCLFLFFYVCIMKISSVFLIFSLYFYSFKSWTHTQLWYLLNLSFLSSSSFFFVIHLFDPFLHYKNIHFYALCMMKNEKFISMSLKLKYRLQLQYVCVCVWRCWLLYIEYIE